MHPLNPLTLFLPLITQRPKRIVYHAVRVSTHHRRTLSQDFYGLFGSIRLDSTHQNSTLTGRSSEQINEHNRPCVHAMWCVRSSQSTSAEENTKPETPQIFYLRGRYVDPRVRLESPSRMKCEAWRSMSVRCTHTVQHNGQDNARCGAMAKVDSSVIAVGKYAQPRAF